MLTLLAVLNITQYRVIAEGCQMTQAADRCGWVPEYVYVGSTINGASPVGSQENSKLVTFRLL